MYDMFILCMCLYVVYISPISISFYVLSIHIQSDESNLSSVEENKVDLIDSTAVGSSDADMIKEMNSKFDTLPARQNMLMK